VAGGRARADRLSQRSASPKGQAGRRTHHRLTLAKYLRFRLGSNGGKTAWFNFFVRPFGAASFAQFWREWNPVYGYFLYYYSYRPLSRVISRPVAMVATFVICGFLLHDLPAWAFARKALPPGATIAFVLFGVGAVVGEWLHMDLSRLPILARAAVNVGYISGCIGAMLLIVRFF
jgi:uncharacterized membrane protein YeaQ/YmgE (transglycosylase-associated protein family)